MLPRLQYIVWADNISQINMRDTFSEYGATYIAGPGSIASKM